ncbi:hypothetical protein EVAR_80098_1 [Eumeta japonica]|uniref:Uncharacterized protein n=1 Tax=Eumeta variegata TaxID=151549 RepID=A0A4C1UCR8_EUMVA|nr:hypothetical protein EVAR_80098_1 [Eumeta japonica]
MFGSGRRDRRPTFTSHELFENLPKPRRCDPGFQLAASGRSLPAVLTTSTRAPNPVSLSSDKRSCSVLMPSPSPVTSAEKMTAQVACSKSSLDRFLSTTLRGSTVSSQTLLGA